MAKFELESGSILIERKRRSIVRHFPSDAKEGKLIAKSLAENNCRMVVVQNEESFVCYKQRLFACQRANISLTRPPLVRGVPVTKSEVIQALNQHKLVPYDSPYDKVSWQR